MLYDFIDKLQYRGVYLEAMWIKNGETCVPVVRVLILVCIRRPVVRRFLLKCTTDASLARKRWNCNIQSADCVILEEDDRRGAGASYKVIIGFSNNQTCEGKKAIYFVHQEQRSHIL